MTWLPSVMNLLFGHGFESWAFWDSATSLSGAMVCGLAQIFFVIRFVDVLGDHGGAFGDIGAQSTGVVEVVMGVDHVLDRLAGDHALGFGDHGRGALVVLAAFDDHDVVL